jgi:ADP-heptose:LPS heptosyltransferase
VPLPPTFLAIRLSSFGDVLMTLPALAALRHAQPRARIVAAVDAPYAGLAGACTAVSEVLQVSKRGLGRLRGDAVAAVSRIALAHWDAAIDFHGFREHAVLTWLSGAPIRTGVFRPGRLGAWCYTHGVPADQAQRLSMRELHVRTLHAAGLIPEPVAAPVAFRFSDAERAAATAGIAGLKAGGPVLALFVGASSASKCWPPQRFAAAATALLEAGTAGRVVIFDGPQERDASAETADRLARFGDRVVVTPVLKILPLAAALAELRPRLFLAADTGPTHLAATIGAERVVALFSPHNRRFAPDPPHRIVVAPEGGAPADIAVDAVVDACTAAAADGATDRGS